MYFAQYGSGTGYSQSTGSRYGSSYGGASYSAGAAANSVRSDGGSSFDYRSSFQNYSMDPLASNSVVESFLAEDRPLTPFISNLGDIKEIVHETFEKLTGTIFPETDVRIFLCDETQFRNVHASLGGVWNDGILGLSLNRWGKDASDIFVRSDHMDRLLLTIGHEIGHVMSPTLPHIQDEEAKAHAFSLAWMETIREHNIAGLQPNILPNPARNGIHDVGYNFVRHLMHTGASAFDIFKTLAHGLTSILATS